MKLSHTDGAPESFIIGVEVMTTTMGRHLISFHLTLSIDCRSNQQGKSITTFSGFKSAVGIGKGHDKCSCIYYTDKYDLTGRGEMAEDVEYCA